jgi:hypothetical protein
MFELIWIVVIGAVTGALAKFIMPGSDPGGFFVTALLGMGGRLSPPCWAGPSGSTEPVKVPASSLPSSGRSSSCSSTAV